MRIRNRTDYTVVPVLSKAVLDDTPGCNVVDAATPVDLVRVTGRAIRGSDPERCVRHGQLRIGACEVNRDAGAGEYSERLAFDAAVFSQILR